MPFLRVPHLGFGAVGISESWLRLQGVGFQRSGQRDVKSNPEPPHPLQDEKTEGHIHDFQFVTSRITNFVRIPVAIIIMFRIILLAAVAVAAVAVAAAAVVVVVVVVAVAAAVAVVTIVFAPELKSQGHYTEGAELIDSVLEVVRKDADATKGFGVWV